MTRRKTSETGSANKDVVRKIFERPKGNVEKVSTLFTHFKHPPKVILPTETKLPLSLKALPAAIDLGTSSIKLLQLAEGPKGEIQIIALDREKYTPKQDNPLAYQREALKIIAGRNRIGEKVVTGLSSKEIQVYNLTFPPMSEAELSEALRWKVTQLKPFGLDIEEIRYDFIKWDNHLTGTAKSAQQSLLLVCASKDTIRQRVALFEEAGLKPVAIEVAPIGLVNLGKFKTHPSMKGEVVIWLDLGAEESSLVMERDGYVCFLKTLPLTSQHITRQIAQHGHISENQAEEAKQQWGLSYWSPDKKTSGLLESEELPQQIEDKSTAVFRGMISSLENLIVEIEHSFKYFSYQVSQSKVTKFDRVILSGGGSNLKNLEHFLSARLGVPVEKANPLGLWTLSDNIRNQRRDFLSSSCDFALAAGWAIAEKTEKARRIVLLTKKEKRPRGIFLKSLKEKPVRAVAIILILVLVLIGFQIKEAILCRGKRDSLSKEVREAQEQLSRSQSNQLELAEGEDEQLKKKAILETRLALLKEATRKPEEFSKVLARVSSLLPEETWITKLSYSESKLTIAGSASNTELVMNLIENLKTLDDFVDVTFGYSQKEPSEKVYNFEMTANIKH